jgi:hypothetical protein
MRECGSAIARKCPSFAGRWQSAPADQGPSPTFTARECPRGRADSSSLEGLSYPCCIAVNCPTLLTFFQTKEPSPPNMPILLRRIMSQSSQDFCAIF